MAARPSRSGPPRFSDLAGCSSLVRWHLVSISTVTSAWPLRRQIVGHRRSSRRDFRRRRACGAACRTRSRYWRRWKRSYAVREASLDGAHVALRAKGSVSSRRATCRSCGCPISRRPMRI
jgi:hypothetical protein